MANKQMLLLVVGLAIAAYAILAMPPMVDDPECISHEVTDDGPRCAERVIDEKKNQFRLPLAMAGGTISLVGGVLYVGDFI
jgi:hypothetical protein